VEKIVDKNIVILSDIGGRDENQDSAGHLSFPDGKIIVVCDGVGGRKSGKIAAQIGVNQTIESFRSMKSTMSPKEALITAIQEANKEILRTAGGSIDLQGMATTICVAYISKSGKSFFLHCGDSRIYHIRRGKLIYRSKDHSWVQDQIDQGLISEVVGRTHEKGNIITSALGKEEFANIRVKESDWKSGDILLITTDGIHDFLSDSRIKRITNSSNSRSRIAHNIMSTAQKIGSELKNMRNDNLTVAIFSQNVSRNFLFSTILPGLFVLTLLGSLIGIYQFVMNPPNSPIDVIEIKSPQLICEELNMYEKLHKVFNGEISDCRLVLDSISFEIGQSQIPNDKIEVVDSVAKIIEMYPKLYIDIIGHADTTGNRALNEDLALARAQEMRDHFEKRGIGSSRLKVFTEGESELDPSNLDKNRVIELRKRIKK
jgi:protein phosphatase